MNVRLFLLIAISSFFLTASAAAEERGNLVRELHDRFQLVVEAPNAWEINDLRSLLRGAEALPPTIWQFIGGPYRIEYIREACLFAMGRYNDSCPTFGADGRFFIYDNPPVAGEGPLESLAILTAYEQRDIQVRRAVVHLALVSIDKQLDWSQTDWWRSINSWPQRRGRPAMNLDPWGYSRHLGMHSAHLDLVTFAEEYFVRPEDLLLEKSGAEASALERLHHLDPNMSMACQQFTKRRILTERLQELDPNWVEPIRRLPHIEAGEPLCPAFDRWARPQYLEDFDILLAAPTASQPESLYGHLLLHVRYQSRDRVHARGFEPVYQFGAVTASDVSSIEYFTRGLLGGFPSILELNTFRSIDRLFLQFQQRNLRRFTLQLSDEQKLHFLHRIWEGERRIRYPYVFLPQNCASFLINLLAPAVDPTLPEKPGAIVMPTDVLDILAEQQNGELGALLVKRADTLKSNRDVADEAVVQRRRLTDELLAELDDDSTDIPTLAQAISSLLHDLEGLDTGDRHRSYEEANQIFDALLQARPELIQDVVEFLYLSVLVERYFMELAHYARRSVYAASASDAAALSIEDQLASRRELYRNEDIEARIATYNERATEVEDRLREGQYRDFTAQEEEILENERRTRRTYLTVLQVQSKLIDDHYPDWNGVAFLDDRAETYVNEMTRIDEKSMGSSGRNLLRMGGGYDVIGNQSTLELSFSAVEDRLGELRRRGYRSNLESRILNLDASIPTHLKGLRQMHLDFILFRYISLDRSYGPVRRGLMDLVGWGFDIRIHHDGRRNLFAGLEITPEFLIPLWTARHDTHHLIAHVGLGIRHDIHREQTPLIGGIAGLSGQLHLYGDFANVARLHLQTGQFLGFGPQHRYDVKTTAELRHVLLSVGQKSLILAPFTQFLWSTRDYRDLAPPQGFRSWRSGVKLEMPL